MLKAYFIVALLFSALAVAVHFGTVQAESSIPKPSVPEFTVTLIDTSYYVSPTTTTDPYTGETVTKGGYYVQGEPEIEIAIKNQPFTPYVDTATNKGVSLFYQVRTKGHFSPDWSIVEYWIKEAPAYNPRNPYPEQDFTSEYTVLKYGSLTSQNIPSEGQLDIQVEALIGYVTIYGDPNHSIDLYNLFASFEFTGESSGWSETQTLTMGEGQTPTPSPAATPTPTSSPAPTPSPTNYTTIQLTEQEIIVGVAIAAVVIGAGLGLLIYLIRRK
jgi:hypothetical protein